MHIDDELKEAQAAGDEVQGPPDPHLLAQVEELRAKLNVIEGLGAIEEAGQAVVDPQAAQPLPGESTREFMHRGLNASGAGTIGPDAEALREAMKEDRAGFLAQVGALPIAEEGLSIERLDSTKRHCSLSGR